MNEQNVIRRLELSLKYSLDNVKTKCIALMNEKAEQIFDSNAFMNCSENNLKTILELDIWKGAKLLPAACIKWAKKHYELESANLKDIRMAMGDLFALIAFAAMDPLDFIKFQRENESFLTAEEVVKVIANFQSI